MPPGYPVVPPPPGSFQRFTDGDELLKAVRAGRVQEQLDMKLTPMLLAELIGKSVVTEDGARVRFKSVTVWWGSEVSVELTREWDYAKPG